MQREYILGVMRSDRLALLVAVLVLGAQATQAAPASRSVSEARARVDHHLHEVEAVAGRLGTVLTAPCPTFTSRAEWKQFQEAKFDDVVLLMAHVEQAWVEAKSVKDDDLRREAKAPRRRVQEGRRLVEKLQGCAAQNHAAFDPLAVWMRIEREVPRRQAEIALPE